MEAARWDDAGMVAAQAGGSLVQSSISVSVSSYTPRSRPLTGADAVLVRLRDLVCDDLSLQNALVAVARSLPAKEGRDVLVALVHVLHQKRKAHLLLMDLITHDISQSGNPPTHISQQSFSIVNIF